MKNLQANILFSVSGATDSSLRGDESRERESGDNSQSSLNSFGGDRETFNDENEDGNADQTFRSEKSWDEENSTSNLSLDYVKVMHIFYLTHVIIHSLAPLIIASTITIGNPSLSLWLFFTKSCSSSLDVPTALQLHQQPP